MKIAHSRHGWPRVPRSAFPFALSSLPWQSVRPVPLRDVSDGVKLGVSLGPRVLLGDTRTELQVRAHCTQVGRGMPQPVLSACAPMTSTPRGFLLSTPSDHRRSLAKAVLLSVRVRRVFDELGTTFGKLHLLLHAAPHRWDTHEGAGSGCYRLVSLAHPANLPVEATHRRGTAL